MAPSKGQYFVKRAKAVPASHRRAARIAARKCLWRNSHWPFPWLGLALACQLAASESASNSPASKPPSNNASTSGTDLRELNLEDLVQIEVTSVAKKAEPLSHSPAAIYVVTQEEIRRNGALTVPEALRLVPGLEVARNDSGGYAISSRGMNQRLVRQLLVLIDGRSVYSLLNSGVAWESLDVMMEDIDRIEVIRGPGATLFGANAVSGVINIITKKAQDTQGALITGGGGTATHGYGGVRYGGQFGTNVFYRIYGTYLNQDTSSASPTPQINPGGGGGAPPGGSGGDPNSSALPGQQTSTSTKDRSENFLGGFRLDWEVSPTDQMVFQGDYLSQRYQYPLSDLANNRNRTGNLLHRWSHTFSDTSGMSLQTYYERIDRDAGIFHEMRHTGDVDFQHNFATGKRNNLVWGLSYRISSDEVIAAPGSKAYFDPESATKQTVSAFVQDEITLVENRLKITPGAKFEHNDFTGFEVQPGLRLLWTPQEKHVFWGAISRAVRTPSREETALVDSFRNSVVLNNPSLDSEKLVAYELGYRFLPRPNLSFDLALFYNDYSSMRTADSLGKINGVDYFTYRNNGMGETYGAEIGANWRVVDRWRLSASYTALQVQMHLKPGVVDPSFEPTEGNTPKNQFQIHSYLDLPGHFELDQGLYYVENLPNQKVDSYFRYDIGLGWRPTSHIEARVSFQNLLEKTHYEQGGGNNPVERGVFAKLTIRF